jgi:hypothetical protein
MMLKRTVVLKQVVSFLVVAAYASEPHEWTDMITYIP